MPTDLPGERHLRAPGSMELDPTAEGVSITETGRLIGSDRVEGTAVFDKAGEQLGTIHNFMVDKYTGQVAYVVLAFGGFLGLGEHHHPLPWRALTYSPKLGGYVVDIDRDKIAEAPRHGAGEDPFADDEYGKAVDAYYRAPPTA